MRTTIDTGYLTGYYGNGMDNLVSNNKGTEEESGGLRLRHSLFSHDAERNEIACASSAGRADLVPNGSGLVHPYPENSGSDSGYPSYKTGYLEADVLTDAQVRKAKAAEKPYKMPDGNGLHLYVTPAGGKHWRYRYEFGGKEKLLSIGSYPVVSIADARAARDTARAAVKDGRDPAVLKKARKLTAAVVAGTSFENVARDWYANQKGMWTQVHASDVLRSLERDVFPEIGSLPISEITPPVVLAALRIIEARGAVESGRRARQRISAVFQFAIAESKASTDPAAMVQKALRPLVKGKQPAITRLTDARQILRDVDSTPAHPVTKLAIRLLALTAVRPGELRGARWTEFNDLEGHSPSWLIPAERMKMKVEHEVPLSSQAVETLNVVRKLSGAGPLVFPSIRHAHKPITENALGYLLNRAGYHGRHVPHGWRATFSTIMNERFKTDRQVIDLMLAHAPGNGVEGAYNRAIHAERRRELAQIWADLLMVDQQDTEAVLVGAFR